MRVLNLYAGIGGNRKLWEDVEVTAVELDPQIAKIYQDFFPKDKVVVGDAHQYLLEHFKEFDFIWSSPPCPSHSDMRRCAVHRGQNEAVYPDMKLYAEIILLKHFAPLETRWTVENVRPYYQLLLPALEIGKHLFWSNFYINQFPCEDSRHSASMEELQTYKGFDMSNYKEVDRRKVLRNCVSSHLGYHILNCARRKEQLTMFA